MMSSKAEVLGGIRFSDLAVWTMAGLGITMAFYSSCKWVNYCNREVGVVEEEEEEEEENENDNDNGIDRLPNDILCNIVSRLKLIEASRTSILSSRWRKIWTMNPELIFRCIDTLNIPELYQDHVVYGHVQRFLKAVNQCLDLYSGGKLKTLTLHCCFVKNHPYHLVRWMETIAKLDVEKLSLGHTCRTRDCNSGQTPDKRFTFSFKLIDRLSKLRHLELVNCHVVTSFVGQCNTLVCLGLRGVSLLRNELSDILLSCPNLRTLCINGCELPLNFKISGPHLMLEELQIYFCFCAKKIEISGINLEKISINIQTGAEVVLSSVPKLESFNFITPGMNYCFEDIPRDLPQLQYLMVQSTQQILRLPPTFQSFRNLRRLYLVTAGVDYNGKALKEVDLWNFAPVLSACPLLKKFYLMVGGPLCKEERKVQQWPGLRHKHLEFMELSGFRNRRNELEFAKFILASAEALRYLKLRTSRRSYYICRFPVYYDFKDSIEIDTEAVCANLRGHALSMLTKVEVI